MNEHASPPSQPQGELLLLAVRLCQEIDNHLCMHLVGLPSSGIVVACNGPRETDCPVCGRAVCMAHLSERTFYAYGARGYSSYRLCMECAPLPHDTLCGVQVLREINSEQP